MTEEHYNLAASVQQALEIAIGRILPPLMREFGTSDFCFAGGVALNCTANARMIRDLGIRSHIHPGGGRCRRRARRGAAIDHARRARTSRRGATRSAPISG